MLDTNTKLFIIPHHIDEINSLSQAINETSATDQITILNLKQKYYQRVLKYNFGNTVTFEDLLRDNYKIDFTNEQAEELFDNITQVFHCFWNKKEIDPYFLLFPSDLVSQFNIVEPDPEAIEIRKRLLPILDIDANTTDEVIDNIKWLYNRVDSILPNPFFPEPEETLKYSLFDFFFKECINVEQTDLILSKLAETISKNSLSEDELNLLAQIYIKICKVKKRDTMEEILNSYKFNNDPNCRLLAQYFDYKRKTDHCYIIDSAQEIQSWSFAILRLIGDAKDSEIFNFYEKALNTKNVDLVKYLQKEYSKAAKQAYGEDSQSSLPTKADLIPESKISAKYYYWHSFIAIITFQYGSFLRKHYFAAKFKIEFIEKYIAFCREQARKNGVSYDFYHFNARSTVDSLKNLTESRYYQDLLWALEAGFKDPNSVSTNPLLKYQFKSLVEVLVQEQDLKNYFEDNFKHAKKWVDDPSEKKVKVDNRNYLQFTTFSVFLCYGVLFYAGLVMQVMLDQKMTKTFNQAFINKYFIALAATVVPALAFARAIEVYSEHKAVKHEQKIFDRIFDQVEKKAKPEYLVHYM